MATGPRTSDCFELACCPVSNPEPGRTKEYGGVVHDGHGVADTCSLTSHRRLRLCAKITVSTSCRCQGYKLLLPDLWRFVALSDIRQDTQAKTYVLRSYHTPQVSVALQVCEIVEIFGTLSVSVRRQALKDMHKLSSILHSFERLSDATYAHVRICETHACCLFVRSSVCLFVCG